MRNFLLLALIFLSAAELYSQITEVTRLPVQDISQSIKESTPVWVSENEIMIFYVNQTKDTIFSTKSNNRGINWEEPKFQFALDSLAQELIYLSALKTKTGRLILSWSIILEGINITYSDDDGETWSPIQIIYGTGPDPTPPGRRIYHLKLSQLDDDRIILCYNVNNSDQLNLYYKESFDDGENWNGIPVTIPKTGGYSFSDHSIISTEPGKLICVFHLKRISSSNYNIYSIFSNDNGITWSDTINISGYASNEAIPRISRDGEGNLWLSYLRNDIVTFGTNINFNVGNIFYRKSTDGGLSWSDENQLTHFIGDDNFPSLNTSGNRPFLSYSTVKFTGRHQIAFGILGETVETYTPPFLFLSESPYSWPSSADSFIVNAYVKDDVAVRSVEYFSKAETEPAILFDDGNHFDQAAGDGIYGNRVYYLQTEPRSTFSLDANKIKVSFSNEGVIADIWVRDTVNSTFRLKDVEESEANAKRNLLVTFPSYGNYEEGSFLFSSGFYLSGYSNGELWTNAVATASLVQDYLAGTVNSNPDDPLFNFYIMRKDDIPFGSSWQRWKDAVNLGAEFYDGDGDGIYNPADKNLNGTWDLNEDMPMILGDMTAWCIYNDSKPRVQRRWNTVEPQGIEIRQTVFASSDPELENVFFIKYKLLNTGSVAEVMDSVYFGVWEDADVGDATDDVVGCDTLLQSGFYYANTPDWQYGENPPSFFTTLLQGPMISTNNSFDTAYNYLGELIGIKQVSSAMNSRMSSHIFFVGGDPSLGDPDNAAEARNYLEGQTRFGVYPNPCTFPYGQVRGGVDCHNVDKHFWFSGDPVTNIGWISTQQRDHRNLISTGPFLLEKDKPQEIIIAYIIGRGTDPLNSITVARENVQRAILEYQSNFASMTYTPPAATNPVTNYVLYQNYPNPFNPTT
ncbi:MAG TPA: sialidase family protein, partial [Ignavibacteriaceae bacterium]|nr:sialidase family protein [Ignavibacteriaceae bacterium]